MSRRWFLSLVVALGLVGALAGATAASADFRSGVHGGEVLDRVASILGIDRTELDDAFAQAKSEIKDEKQAETLATLVENGTLNDAEAAEIGDWLDARPAALDNIKPDIRGVFKFHGGSLDHTGSSGALNIPAISPEQLARLVEADKLSQEDADAIQAWLDARPDAVDKLVPAPLRSFEGIAPFGGGGFFRFDGDQQGFDMDGLRKRLEQFRSDLEDGLPDLNGEFFQFDGDGFDFEFRGNGPGFFFRGGRGGDGHGFTPPAPESTSESEPINI